MAQEDERDVLLDDQTRALANRAQEPLRAYFNYMIPKLVEPNGRRSTSRDMGEFLIAVDEAKYLNGDKIQEALDALAREVPKVKEYSYAQDLIDVMVEIIVHSTDVPTKETPIQTRARHVNAEVQALALIQQGSSDERATS